LSGKKLETPIQRPMTDDTPRVEITRRHAVNGIATIGALGTVAGVGAATSGNGKDPTQFTVRVENVASLDEYPSAPDPPLSTGGAVWITPGAYGIYKGSNPILSRNKAASSGLEAIAEAGRPSGTPENDSLVAELRDDSKVAEAGAWTPADTVADPNDPLGSVPGAPPIASGGAFEFDIEAAPGQKLAFATMFVPSNDVFFAPGPGGINLFEDDAPVEGSVTDDVRLWDAGTEPNEDPSSDSPNQAPRQGLEFGNPDKGPDEDGVVRELRPTDKVDDGYSYPDPSEAIDVTITPQ
jgi:hypothetical protein